MFLFPHALITHCIKILYIVNKVYNDFFETLGKNKARITCNTL